MFTQLQMFNRWMKRNEDEARAKLARFKDAVATDPVYAVKNSDDAFEAAAKLEVVQRVGHFMACAMADLKEVVDGQEERMLARVEREALRRMVEEGRDLCASTSGTNVLYHRCLIVAWNRAYTELFAEGN